MSFFEYFFSDVSFSKSETMVCCPFTHKTINGLEFTESNPSAGVNLNKGVFHCLSCGASHSETGFINSILGGTYESANALRQFFKDTEDATTWKTSVQLPQDIEEKIRSLGIANSVIQDLDIRSEDGKSISFPVFLYGKIIDVRNYRPGETPKLKARYNSMAGIVYPFDLWNTTPATRWTWICAGEKDMAVARSQGLNAITITGGENALPSFTKHFENRRVAIVYDNDEAGLKGARALAAHLKSFVAEVRVVTKFHEICKEPGEDITDYFTKYHKTKEDLIACLQQSPVFTEEDAAEERERITPTITLLEASQPRYVNRLVRSNVQVVATFEGSFIAPTFIEGKKTAISDGEENPTMPLNSVRTWELSDKTLIDVLHLIDNKFKEDTINENIRSLLRIPSKEKNVTISKPSKTTIFKCSVTDLFESNVKNASLMEYNAYSIGNKLESGKKYKATYKLVPHPYNGQQLIMLITDVEEASDTVNSFKISPETISLLQQFQEVTGTVPEKLHKIVQKVKGIINFDANDQLIEIIDLAFHTVLYFNFGRFESIRGYLDTLVISESRVGKSSTAEALRQTYNLGVFASLAGSSATKGGLIGGSNKVNGSYQIRAGLIPQNHQGMIIFEELAKCKEDILMELTDIRSSNQVRLQRVSGTLSLPATVRMLTLTNVKSQGGINRPITSYPNGIEILTQLIGTAEDMARYDIMLILGHPGNNSIDPTWEPETPFSTEAYRARIRWIWSRTESQIKISNDLAKYIIDRCNELNKIYDCHIKIFGTEAWKKISRLAIALAGYLVSTDESYENILVTQEHVDQAVRIFVDLYDNPTFKLKEYVDSEARYRQIDNDAIQTLQQLYITHATLLNQLEQSSSSARNELMAATGLANDQFNVKLNELVNGLFIRFQGNNIIPTERFRIGMSKITRNTRHKKVGEVNEIRVGNKRNHDY